MSTNLYESTDEKAKAAAEEWMLKIAPRLQAGAEEWLKENPDVDAERYQEIVHPLLMWRFFHHLSVLLETAAEGWAYIYGRDTGG